jgi:hypothetical protein
MTGQIFVPEDYGIIFPDSLYQTTSLTTRKVRHSDFSKSFGVFAFVENGQYKVIRLLVNNQKTLDSVI